MDLVPLIDALGEQGAALAGGAVLGAVFGFFAQRTAFCTRSAVLDVTRGRDGKALATWTAGLAVAVLGVQLLLLSGRIDVGETRFFATAQSLSGAIIGGLLFGVGMVLARGCVSRLLVLSASGNLRALFSIIVVAIVGFATYDGILVPMRDTAGALWRSSEIGGNDLLVHAGAGHVAGAIIGVLLLATAFALSRSSRLPARRFAGAAIVGATIVGGWYFTYSLSTQVFEPIQAESLSFIRPLATSTGLAASGGVAGFDQGLLLGTIAGALVAALCFGAFRIATFSEPGTPSALRYASGSALMGFGGILAVGCTIGAGFTGGSVLAVSSVAGLGSMILGATLADLVVDRERDTSRTAPAGVPAE